MPAGAIKRNAYLSVVNFSASYNGKGLLPTILISPINTFTNCGNSSILVLRKILPTLVTRGSSLILMNAEFAVAFLNTEYFFSHHWLLSAYTGNLHFLPVALHSSQRMGKSSTTDLSAAAPAVLY